MPVSFAQIPSNIRVPLYWVEVDPSMAGLPVIKQPSLLIGTMLPGDFADGLGEAVPLTPIPIGTQAQADKNFGLGSELSRMFRSFYKNNWANEVWGLGVLAPVGSTQASGQIKVLVPPREAGTIHLYLAGEYVRGIVVSHLDTVIDVARKIVDRINADVNLPMTAEVNTTDLDTVDLTSVWAGDTTNDLRVDINIFGTRGSELTPIGLELELPATGFLTGGAGVPDLTDAIINMGEQQFEYVCMPFSDSTSLLAMEMEFGFSDSGRWGWQRQHFGHVFTAKRGTYEQLRLWGPTRNSGIISVMGFERTSPSAAYDWAAAYTAKAQRALTNDPARPLQSLSLNGVRLAPLEDRFNFQELNSLALNGIAIQKAGSDNQPMIAREQTTYQLNLYGQTDDAYELVTTLATLARIIRNQRHAITSKFPRHKLANDGTRFGPGQAIVTPGIIKAELVAQYRIDEFNGLVEDMRNYKRHLIVERDPNDPNRVNVLYPPDLVNQLRIFAVLAQFRLQYDRGVDVEILGGAAAGPRQASSFAR
jgi:phage tail sheath gpL-like